MSIATTTPLQHRGSGRSQSEVEHLPKLGHRVLRARDGVADRPGVLVDLVVVSALVGLVAKEVDRGEALVLDVVERERLVPSGGARAW